MILEHGFNQDVAVIIPVYNRGDKFRCTLNSVDNQYLKNILIVVIDDGSEEDIKGICKDFSYRRNIYYIRNQKNLGVAKSRQIGLDFVLQTEIPFLFFLDADDTILPDTLLHMFNQIAFSEEDFCIGDRLQIYPENPIKNTPRTTYSNTVWITNKLFKTSFLKKYKQELKFKDFVFHEDLYFSLMCLNRQKSIRFTKRIGYLQTADTTGLTSIKINHYGKNSMEYTMLQAVYHAMLDSEHYHPLTINFFFASYQDYQICKYRNIDLTEIDELLFKLSKRFQLSDIPDICWDKCSNTLKQYGTFDKDLSDYDQLTQYVFFEESFFQWAKRFNFISNNTLPMWNPDYYFERIFLDEGETEWQEIGE